MRALLGLLLCFLPVPAHPLCAGKGLHLRWRLGWLKTQFIYRPCFALRAAFGGTRVHWGRRIAIQGCLKVRGPGEVHLGDDVLIDDHVTLFTHDPKASIRIGARTFLNGTRMGSVLSITVGEGCILADARIMDTDFHSVGKLRNKRDAAIARGAVALGDNVWVAAGAGILKGVSIGADSVVAFQSVVTVDVPSGRIFAGNPARDVGAVPI